jgi:hypothetical protein
VLDWLLDADPALRWQVLRGLTDAPPEVVAAERARVAVEGWGARLLAARDADGQWAGGACFPASGWSREDGGQPWTATLPTLDLLRLLGLDPASAQARETVALVRRNCRWEYDDLPFFDGEVDSCINGRTVAIGAYFGEDVEPIVGRLLTDQLADGGWNCWAAETGSTRSSFDSTLGVLEGLLAHEQATGGTPDTIGARRRGEAYLLERSLFRRRSTGEPVKPEYLALAFPPQWHYDVLRALEYFRQAGRTDERLADAVELVRGKQQPDGTWLLEHDHPGAVHFVLEEVGGPSRWNTLRALRVLRWHEQVVG